MSGWTKLFSSIVTSSVWVEDNATLRVWIAMLATASADGIVEGSIPGFANLARVTASEMRAAIEKLSAPDPDSRTPAHEGRRIEAIEGGWRILNYGAYRERGQEKEGSRAPYFRAYRRRRKEEAAQQPRNTSDVARNTEERRKRREAERTTEQGPAADAASPAGAGRSPVSVVFRHWQDAMGRPGAKLSPKRERSIRGRLRDGFTVEQLLQAIDGCKASPFHQGENDRHQRYDDLTLILRDPEHVEKFIALATTTTTKTNVQNIDLEAYRREYTERRRAAVGGGGR